MPDAEALVDEIANELATWPGVHIERRGDGAARVRYERSTLGLLSCREIRGEDDPYSAEDPE
jgi:hypothetical protein